MLDLQMSNDELLYRICQIYGFSQKIQLARHFNIAASSLQNRYTRGTISYDFAVHCALETGASLNWLFGGQGEPFEGKTAIGDGDIESVELFTLSEGRLSGEGTLSLSSHFFARPFHGIGVRADNKLHFIDQKTSLSDGVWLVDIEGAISIRELTVLPGKKLHVAGGKVPFECGIDEIKTQGRVVGVYSDVG